MEPATTWSEYSERYSFLDKMKLAFAVHELQNILGKINDGTISPDNVSICLDQTAFIMACLTESDSENIKALLKKDRNNV